MRGGGGGKLDTSVDWRHRPYGPPSSSDRVRLWHHELVRPRGLAGRVRSGNVCDSAAAGLRRVCLRGPHLSKTARGCYEHDHRARDGHPLTSFRAHASAKGGQSCETHADAQRDAPVGHHVTQARERFLQVLVGGELLGPSPLESLQIQEHRLVHVRVEALVVFAVERGSVECGQSESHCVAQVEHFANGGF